MGRQKVKLSAQQRHTIGLRMSDDSYVVFQDAMTTHNIRQIELGKPIQRTFSEFIRFCAGVGAKDIKAAAL